MRQRGLIVTFDPTVGSKQAQVLDLATPFRDGIMSMEQAAKLDSLNPTPPAPDCCPVITFQNNDYDAIENDVVLANINESSMTVTLPEVGSFNSGKIITIKIVAVSGIHTVTVLPTGANTVNGGASDSLASGSKTYISDGLNTWWQIY